MHRTFVAAALAFGVLSAGGPAAAAAAPTAEDCIFWDAAFKAVEPVLDKSYQTGHYRRFASHTFGRPRGDAAHGRAAEPATALRYCVALQQRVAAASIDFVARSPFGLRLFDRAPYEHFSRPVREGRYVYVTYYFGETSGANLTMHQNEDGSWVLVGEPETWETIVLT